MYVIFELVGSFDHDKQRHLKALTPTDLDVKATHDEAKREIQDFGERGTYYAILEVIEV